MNDALKPQWRLIHLLRNIVLGGLIVSVFYHWIQDNTYPGNTFLFNPGDRFADFTNWIQYEHYQLLAQWGAPPFSLLLATFWKEIAAGTTPWISFCIFSFSCLALHSWIVFCELGRWGRRTDFASWAILSFLTYPVLFAFDRGNVAWMVYLSIYGFFHFCRRGNYQIAALLLAIAIATKIVPILLLFYLLYRGKWLSAICSVAEAAALSFAGYLVVSRFFYPYYSLDLFFRGMSNYIDFYVLHGAGLAFSSSFHSLVILLLHFYASGSDISNIPMDWSQTALTYSNIFTVGVAVVICAWVWFRGRPTDDAKLASLLVLLVLFVPPVMGDYYLLLVYLLFFDLFKFDLSSMVSKVYAICVGLLLIPKAYGHFFGDVSFSVLLNPVLILIMLGCLLLSEWRQPVPEAGRPVRVKESSKKMAGK